RGPGGGGRRGALGLLDGRAGESGTAGGEVGGRRGDRERRQVALRRDVLSAVHGALVVTAAAGEDPPAARRLAAWRRGREVENVERYGCHLYSEGPRSTLAITR